MSEPAGCWVSERACAASKLQLSQGCAPEPGAGPEPCLGHTSSGLAAKAPAPQAAASSYEPAAVRQPHLAHSGGRLWAEPALGPGLAAAALADQPECACRQLADVTTCRSAPPTARPRGAARQPCQALPQLYCSHSRSGTAQGCLRGAKCPCVCRSLGVGGVPLPLHPPPVRPPRCHPRRCWPRCCWRPLSARPAAGPSAQPPRLLLASAVCRWRWGLARLWPASAGTEATNQAAACGPGQPRCRRPPLLLCGSTASGPRPAPCA